MTFSPTTYPPESTLPNLLSWWRRLTILLAALFGVALALVLHNLVAVKPGQALAGELEHATVIETPSAILAFAATNNAPHLQQAQALSPFSGRWIFISLLAGLLVGLIATLALPKRTFVRIPKSPRRTDRWWSGLVPSKKSLVLDAAVCFSGVLTIACFAFLNNVYVASFVWGREAIETKRSERHTLRNEFLNRAGLLTLPAHTNHSSPGFSNLEAQIRDYLGEKTDLAALVPAETGTNLVAAFFGLLNKDDKALLAELKAYLNLNSVVIARPANTALGFLALTVPSVHTSGTVTIIEAPTIESIRRRLLPALPDGSPDDQTKARASVTAQLFKAELDEIDESATIVVARRFNGLIQFLTVLPFIFGVLLILWRIFDRVLLPPLWLQDYLAKHPLLKRRLPLGPVAVRVLHRVEEQSSNPSSEGVQIIHRTLQAAYRGFLTNRNPVEGEQAVQSQSSYYLDRMYSEHAIIRFLAWVIPSIGFVGTVIGIGNALLRAKRLVDPAFRPADALQGVVSELGLAFDTTFVALLASIGLMLAFYRLQRREEHVLLDVRQVISDRIVLQFSRDSLEIDTIELTFTLHSRDGENWERIPQQPWRYRARIVDITGNDPLEGYKPSHLSWVTLRVLSHPDDPTPLPQRGLILEVHLGAPTDEQEAHLTDAGLRQFLETYFQWQSAPRPTLLRLLEWCDSRGSGSGPLSELKGDVQKHLEDKAPAEVTATIPERTR